MLVNQQDIEHLYNSFIRSNSELYDININTIFRQFHTFLDSQNYYLPNINANSLDVDTIRQGKDFCLYIVKKCSNDSKYWKKIN